MYLSEDEINKVIDDTDICEVIGRYTPLTLSDGIYTGKCPFCDDGDCFVVDPDKKTYTCFACGKSGNVINFLMDVKHESFFRAYSELSESVPSYDHEDRSVFLDMNDCALDLFKKNLPASKSALSYVKKRKLTEETVKKFQLGFIGNTKKEIYNCLKKEGFGEDDIKRSGLVNFYDNGPVDKFSNRLMFPIQNVEGKVIGFGGRILTDPKEKEAKYLNSPETPVFDKSANLFALNFAKDTKEDFFILCEGYMDVISMHQAGFTNAVASLGTAFTRKQAEILASYGKKIVLSYDTDGPGISAAERAVRLLREQNLEFCFLKDSSHKDPDEFIKAEGKEAFADYLKDTLDLKTWLYNKAEQMNDPDFFIRNYV